MLSTIRNRLVSPRINKMVMQAARPPQFYSTKPLIKLNPKLYDPVPVNGNGFVRLVDHMPRVISAPLYCDAAIPEMARISYGGTSENDTPKPRKKSTDEALIRYLMRNYHTSPFEAVEFKFHLKIPIFVERQLIRHRTANVNQISGRYSVLPDDYYVPEKIRKQSSDNKQGSQGVVDETNHVEMLLAASFRERCRNRTGHKQYETLVKHNVAKEMARITLPQNIMTELYWKIDLHNLLHFLYLRQDTHAQEEIRDVANVLFSIVKDICPVSTQAFLDYRMNSVTFTACELQAIRMKNLSCIPTKREKQEFKNKSKLLDLDWIEK